MSATKKIIQQSETTTVDKDGVFQQQTETRVFTFPKEPPYIKIYLQDIEKLYTLPEGTHRVLFELLKKLDYEGQINLNISVKRNIIKNIGWKTVGSLDNYISLHLMKKDIFKKIDTGVFAPNPNLFGRGDWKEIYQRREGWIKIEYNSKGRKVTTNYTEENGEENEH
tara:strand:- start:821 stop:1321 length:501 start_codon:yes stop_codon:yes gene_type:complete